MLKTLLNYSTPILLIAILVLQILSFGGGGFAGGGDTNYDSIDVTDGYKVDGTTRIDGSGVGKFATIDASTIINASSSNLGTNTAATSTLSINLLLVASSTGIIFEYTDSTCVKFLLDAGANVSTSTVSCN